MTNFEKNITESAREYSLSSDEKARMKRVISEYARHKPLRTEGYSTTVQISWISILYRPVAAALVLVLVSGTGVSYAAETALPGDILSSVKTAINEPVRVAIATSAEAKAEVQIELAERRIEEATTLAADGRLDEETEDELAAAFEVHAAAVAESFIEADEIDATTSVELASRFENRLAAHEMVLAEVGFELDMEESADVQRGHRLADAIRVTNATLAETRFDRSPVAMAYDSAANMAMMAADAPVEADPAAMTMSLATSEPVVEVTMEARTAKMAVTPAPEPLSAPDARSLSRIENAAARSLKNAQKGFRSAKSLSADAKARATADIALAEEQLVHGKELLKTDADAEAYLAFQESNRVSEQAFVFIKAAPALEKARSRNVRNQRSDDRSSQKGESIEAVINVTLPGAGVDATATVTIATGTRPRSDDGPAHDANDDHGEDDPNHDLDDHGGERKDESSEDGLINGAIKLDLSL